MECNACRVVAVAVAVTAVGCGGSDAGAQNTSTLDGCFIAYDNQFDGFRSWPSFHYDGKAQGGSFVVVHTAGPRTEYLKSAPPHRSAAFPLQTTIVKEIGANDPANHSIFAMVKRGCGFNASGATGWEWMELTERDGGASILWRGSGPPAGERYAGDPTSCNTCHVTCADNDHVCSPVIRLASY
jgi:hypothetical protein